MGEAFEVWGLGRESRGGRVELEVAARGRGRIRARSPRSEVRRYHGRFFRDVGQGLTHPAKL